METETMQEELPQKKKNSRKKLKPFDYEYRLLKLIDTARSRKSPQKAEEFWHEYIICNSTPLVVNNRVYFLYYGDAARVEVAGDWSRWQPDITLSKIGQTRLFYAVKEFPETARLQYKIIIDGNWQPDIHNSQTSQEGFGLNSEFCMSLYEDNSHTVAPEGFGDADRGQLEKFVIPSSAFGAMREIYLYTPKMQEKCYDFLPLAVFHDGGEAIAIGKYHEILDHLIFAKKIPPVAALFIPPDLPNRNKEYTEDSAITKFTKDEALPFAIERFLEKKLLISQNPQDRCVIGASLAGLLSTRMAFQHPDIFGSGIIQSPSYWWNKRAIFRTKFLENAGRLRIIFQTGTIHDARENTLLMYGKLKRRKAAVHYEEFHQGHTWGNWRSGMATALRRWVGDLRE